MSRDSQASPAFFSSRADMLARWAKERLEHAGERADDGDGEDASAWLARARDASIENEGRGAAYALQSETMSTTGNTDLMRVTQLPGGNKSPDHTLALLLPLLILLTTLLFLLLLFLLFLLFVRRQRGIALSDEDGPTNLEHEDQVDGEGGIMGVEHRWLEEQDESTRIGYARAKVWQSQYPPNSLPTDITLSQLLSIQEKGVSAWSFEPDYESNPGVYVESRTEITFLADSVGMAPDEGGGANVQSNLPLPRQNEVYYFECKMYDKPENTLVAIGLATKPYPSFRMPGWNKFSVGYFSADGFKCHTYPFTAQSYGPPLEQGDTLGVGYRPRTGTVFFTRNGKKLEDAFIGFNRHNLFPTIGANNACSVHVNFGQAGFVFIEANVKKWGLAPSMGTLAPPPAYGSEHGSILLQSANARDGATSSSSQPAFPHSDHLSHLAASRQERRRHHHHHHHHRHHRPRTEGSSSSQPAQPSPLRRGMQHSRTDSDATVVNVGPRAIVGSGTPPSPSTPSSPSRRRRVRTTRARDEQRGMTEEEDGSSSLLAASEEQEEPHNPPTPGLLDISLHSMHAFPRRVSESSLESSARAESELGDSDAGSVDHEREGHGGEPSARRETQVVQEEEEREDESEGSCSSCSGEGSPDEDGGHSHRRRCAQQSGAPVLRPTHGLHDAGRSSSAIVATVGGGATTATGGGPTGNEALEPPTYSAIDPNMYAPGVAEALLEDALRAHPSARHSAPGAQGGSGTNSSAASSSRRGAGASTRAYESSHDAWARSGLPIPAGPPSSQGAHSVRQAPSVAHPQRAQPSHEPDAGEGQGQAQGWLDWLRGAAPSNAAATRGGGGGGSPASQGRPLGGLR